MFRGTPEIGEGVPVSGFSTPQLELLAGVSLLEGRPEREPALFEDTKAPEIQLWRGLVWQPCAKDSESLVRDSQLR